MTFFRNAVIFTVLSPVAQLAEQVAVNHWVRGSNPCGGVILQSRICGFEGFSPLSEYEEKAARMRPSGLNPGLEPRGRNAEGKEVMNKQETPASMLSLLLPQFVDSLNFVPDGGGFFKFQVFGVFHHFVFQGF